MRTPSRPSDGYFVRIENPPRFIKNKVTVHYRTGMAGVLYKLFRSSNHLAHSGSPMQ
jgi:hypothetical protein